MEIIIHGTKGGYKILYSTSGTSQLGLRDVRPISINERAIGTTAYAVAFSPNGTLFTKYLIVRDMLRNMAPGNIAFSMFLPKSNRLSGKEIQTVLDEITREYRDKYVQDFKLDNIREDWSFTNAIVDKYRHKPNILQPEDQESLNSGNEEGAYIYFKDNEQLQKYFDDPFHEAYRAYQQIFFIGEEFKESPKNPLQALRHAANANLTGKIDLDNPKYKIIFNTKDVKLRLSVEANDSPCANKERVRKKDNLSIKWKKSYYEEEAINGSIGDENFRKDESIHIDDEQRTITIYEKQLTPKQKEFKINIKPWKSNTDNYATIKATPHSKDFAEKKGKGSNHLTFVGEEIGGSWKIQAIKDKLTYSEEKDFLPDETSETIELRLDTYKNVKLTICDETGRSFSDKSHVLVNGENCRINKDNIIKLKNQEIEKPLKIKISCKGFKRYYRNYQPHELNDGKLIITLEKEKSPPPLPKQSGKNNGISKHKVQNRFPSKIKRLIFSKPFILVGTTLAVLAVIICLFVYKNNNSKEMPKTNDEISTYTEGNELLPDSLKKMKLVLEKSSRDFSWLDFRRYLPKGGCRDSNELSPEDSLLLKVKDALKIRTYINSFNVDSLTTCSYSEQQEEFKKIINKVDSINKKDSEQFNKIKECFSSEENNYDNQKLSDITKELQKCITNNPEKEQVNSKEIDIPIQKQTDTINEIGKHFGEKEQKEKDKKIQPPIENETETTNSGKQNNDTKIKEYLKGDELNVSKLKDYEKNTQDETLKKSINLCLKFWELNGKKNNSYWSYLNDLNKDHYLKSSKLKSFVENIEESSHSPHYPVDIQGYKNMSLKDVMSIIEKNKIRQNENS